MLHCAELVVGDKHGQRLVPSESGGTPVSVSSRDGVGEHPQKPPVALAVGDGPVGGGGVHAPPTPSLPVAYGDKHNRKEELG